MKVNQNVNLSEFLWYKIGGTAKYVLDVSNVHEVQESIEFIQKNNIQQVFVLGLGANLIFTLNYFDGAIIRFVQPQGTSIRLIGEDQIEAFAGETLDDVIQFGFDHNLIGLEWAGGLPSTVGASVRGNVGAFGGEVKDLVEKVEVVDKSSNEIKVLANQYLNFSYRESIVKKNKNLIVTSATFKFKKATNDELKIAKETYQKNIDYRKARHPLEHPNTGSVFKNIHTKENVEKVLNVFPEMIEDVEGKWHGKVSMAAVIARLGLSGFRVGNAQISQKHSNFIVNLGGAKASDVLALIETIQLKCNESINFVPEVEVEIVR